MQYVIRVMLSIFNPADLFFLLKQAFTAFDQVGNNFVTANDIVNSKLTYRLPFTKEVSKECFE